MRSFDEIKKTSLVTKTKQTLNKFDSLHQKYSHLCILDLKKLQASDMVIHLNIGKNKELEF